MTTKQLELSTRFVASVKPAAPGKRDEYRDTVVKNFALRVTDRGAKTYLLNMRWPGGKMTIRRRIGDAGSMPLAEARDIAREWLRLAEKGIDPEVAKKQRAAEEARARATPFEMVAEDYIAEWLSTKRRGAKDAQEIRRELVSRWRGKPVTKITRDDVLAAVEAVKARGKLATAHLILSHAKRIWRWALHQPSTRYGITDNPTREVSPMLAIGQKATRDRVLSDAELGATWRALASMDEPEARCLQLIMLTSMRRGEAEALSWKEVDLDGERLITLPAPRFKSEVKFCYPLSDDAVTLLRSIEHGRRGDYVFSNDDGVSAISSWSRFVYKLHQLIAEELGSKPDVSWSPHDIRRTVRSNLSRLRVPREIAELCIGHVKTGLVARYDVWEAMEERREAFAAWASFLKTIVTPPEREGKVVHIKRRRA
jgi:integrase